MSIVAACGGVSDLAGVPDASLDSSGAPADGGADDGASTKDAAVASDAPSAADAGIDAPAAAADGGTGGLIGCGAEACLAGTQSCCDRGNDAAACTALAGPCNLGWQLFCDDVTDCDGGRICCLEPTLATARCLPTCVTGLPRHQLCGGDAECAQPGQTCQRYTCPGGHTVRACEEPFGCSK
jgi:hypothetical protein